MGGQSGGVAAAFGFRYQYLITVEILLDLFESGRMEWAVDVDRAEQDSADIIVRLSATGPPARAIQVKASLPESSTTIGVTKVRAVLTALANEHPAAAWRELITNRTMTAELKQERAADGSSVLSSNEKFEPRTDNLSDLTSTLLLKINRVRGPGAGGLGSDLHYLLLRQLVDIVHEAGSRSGDQCITREAVRKVLEGPAPVLSNALGARRWGTCIRVPIGNYIERPTVTNFLRNNLPNSAIYSGSPGISVIHGLSGTGKTSAASLFARSQLEHVAFVLWLDASSPAALEAQLPVALDELGVRVPIAEPTAQGLSALLGDLPVPWLLVLDGARSIEEIEAWVPRSGYGLTLITTTRADWPQSFAPSLHLDQFSPVEVREFFSERLESVKMWSDEQSAACDDIARRLSNWPLALELAASWIQRRGASLDVMRQFTERIERLDLDDEHLLPYGYPRTATQVVIDLWAELSPQAQRVVSTLLLLGGAQVPERLITDWARSLDLPVGDALEELFAASVIQRRIRTSGSPHDYDETIEVHDFLKLVIKNHSVELDSAAVNSLIETSEQSLASLMEAGEFREGATLVRPLDHLLRTVSEACRDEPMALIRQSVLMHNLGQMAVLTSNASVAGIWYAAAFNVRRAAPEYFEGTPEGVLVQLQTLAGAATVMARQNAFVGLLNAAENARALLEGTDASIYEDAQTQSAVISILQSVARSPEALAKVSPWIHLIREGSAASDGHIDTIGGVKVRELQGEMALAIKLVEADQWHLGIDRALAAANYALEESLLVDWILDGLLDVGFVLMIAVVRRQHELPESLLGCLQRVVVWFNENPAELDQSEQQRLHLLQGVATGKSSAVRTATANLSGLEEHVPMIHAWYELANVVADQLDRFQGYEIFADLPESVTVDIAVDGGDRINYWQATDMSNGAPMLWVCTASRIRYESGGKVDPVREAFLTAGLPLGYGDARQTALGWSATLREDSLDINDGTNIPRVHVDDVGASFCERICAAGGLVLLYGDPGQLTSGQDHLIPCGWVPLALDSSKGKWQERLLNWWRRGIMRGIGKAN